MSVTKRYIIFDKLEQEESREILDTNYIQVSITLDTNNIDAQLEKLCSDLVYEKNKLGGVSC